ncbi:hypothetical protein CCC_01024 [Paramagnetospirillum magnetotacticum MS-1]|uniref:DUF2125 domain-containing protein n=1 Tax=Paramagnetospirillum magnetotacticum MS-1 TaxID=272627 RepID=A0A0C2YS53_PARME|nr:DUF2125 domain-containing protein [Paramagnetospirillum magnetotacticum]KIL97963.1 hypothetical protein CCC_01024 [Paramagnetospirillum magnetotacticum MS-1]
MPMPVRFRLAALIAAFLALAGCGGYTAYWFHVAGQLRKGIEDFAASRRADGWHLDYGPVALFGFPGQIGLDLGALNLSTPSGLAWSSDGVRLRLPGLDPMGPVLDLGTSHTLAMGNEWRGIVTTTGATVRLRVDGDGDLHDFAFEAGRLALEQPGAGPLTAERLAIRYEWLNPPDPGHEKPSAGFALNAQGVEMGLPADLPFNRRLDLVRVEGRIMGTIPDTAPLSALAAWSNAGGTVELDKLAVDWAPLSLEADGTFAFDPMLQPLIATTARIRGWKEVVSRLVEAKLMEPGMASAAEILLAILARPDPQGRPTLTLSVTVQDGDLYAGQVKLLRLPPLPITPPGPGAPPP